jgi:hypothetical protein
MKRTSKHFPRVCCVISVIVITLFGAGACASAQTASTAPAFEVATIEPFDMSTFNGTHHWVHVYQARSSYWAMNLKSLLSYAYSINLFQVTGPGSIDSRPLRHRGKIPQGRTEGRTSRRCCRLS